MIRILKHTDIDRERWDICIQNAEFETIYPYTWYLELVSPGWEALVLDDYEEADRYSSWAHDPAPDPEELFFLACEAPASSLSGAAINTMGSPTYRTIFSARKGMSFSSIAT